MDTLYSADALAHMVARQAGFQHVVNGNVETDADRVAVTKDLLLRLTSEMSELMDEIEYKARRGDAVVSIPNVYDEIIDMLKLVLGIAVTWDMSAEDVLEQFDRKSSIIESRYKHEKPILEMVRSNRHQNVVVVDIDGVLADYPMCVIEWAVANEYLYPEEFDFTKDSVMEAAKCTYEEAERIKYQYRESGAIARAPIRQGAKGFLSAVRGMGYFVILATARPASRHPRIMADTADWLRDGRLTHDAVIWDTDKERRIIEELGRESVVMFIDDKYENVHACEKAGIPAYRFAKEPDQDGYSFVQLMEILQGRNNES